MKSHRVWYPWKAILKGHPTVYISWHEDEFLRRMLAITGIAPLSSYWQYWWLSNLDFSYLDVPSSCMECSPSVLYWFGQFLEYFKGENMGFISRISRVWVFLGWNGPVGVHYVWGAGKRVILMGYHFPGVMVACFPYKPCICLYVQYISRFTDIRTPPSLILVVDCVLGVSRARSLCDTNWGKLFAVRRHFQVRVTQ